MSTQNLDVQKQNYFNMTQPEENHIDVDGIQFRTVLIEQAVKISSLSSDTKIQFQFGIQITNNTEYAHQFLLFFARSQFLRFDGTVVRAEGPNFNKRKLPRLTDFQLILSRQSITFLMNGFFRRSNNYVGFGFNSNDGGGWYFKSFIPGTYSIQVVYENYCSTWENSSSKWSDITDLDEFANFEPSDNREVFLSPKSNTMRIGNAWTGKVTTPPVKFNLL